MKYDSSMTQFHGDIVAALRLMCGNDKIAQTNANGASPAPLRDYIKSKYGNSGSSEPGGSNYFATPSKGVDIKFDGMTVTLSWSQTAKFIRDNTSEIFSEDESADDDILPDKNSLELLCNTFDESEIKCPFWRTGETMRYLNFGGVDFKCDYCECSFCEFDKLTEFLASHCHDYEECLYYRKHKDDKSNFPCDDCGYDVNNCCSYPDTPDDYCVCGDKKIPVPAQTDTAVAAFDYSELDADTAHNLKECETVIRTETAGYFTILGAKFKEAQDLLANHSSGTFEQWYTSMGFKRQTVYNLIQRFEFSSSPTIGGREEAFEALPLTLSYEISKPAAPAELVDKVLNGDITSNAEYRRLKAELERTREELRQVDANSAAKDKEYKRELEESEKRAENAENSVKKLRTELSLANDNLHNVERNFNERETLRKKMDDENLALKLKIKEMESRPIEATFTDNSEELEKKDKEISELKEEIERLSDKNVKVFAIRLTVDEYERLVGIVRDSNDLVVMEAVKKAQIIRL